MSAFVKIDLHGMHQEDAIKVIDRAIRTADSATYQIQLIHGYNRGTSLRNMKIYAWVFGGCDQLEEVVCGPDVEISPDAYKPKPSYSERKWGGFTGRYTEI